MPPSLSIAKFVGQIKGAASASFNKKTTAFILYWQEEYGVFSFDKKRLPNIIAYVNNQKHHHAQSTLIPALERSAPLPDPSMTHR